MSQTPCKQVLLDKFQTICQQ